MDFFLLTEAANKEGAQCGRVGLGRWIKREQVLSAVGQSTTTHVIISWLTSLLHWSHMLKHKSIKNAPHRVGETILNAKHLHLKPAQLGLNVVKNNL